MTLNVVGASHAGELLIRDARPGDRDRIREVTLAAYQEYAAQMPDLWEGYRQNIVATLARVEPAETDVPGGLLGRAPHRFEVVGDGLAGVPIRLEGVRQVRVSGTPSGAEGSGVVPERHRAPPDGGLLPCQEGEGENVPQD